MLLLLLCLGFRVFLILLFIFFSFWGPQCLLSYLFVDSGVGGGNRANNWRPRQSLSNQFASFSLGPSPSKTNKRRVCMCVCTRSKQVRGTRRCCCCCCCCSRDVRLTFLRLSSQPVNPSHTYIHTHGPGNQPAYFASSPLSPSKAELLPRFKPSDSQKIQS
jgi:hypothetical protein